MSVTGGRGAADYPWPIVDPGPGSEPLDAPGTDLATPLGSVDTDVPIEVAPAVVAVIVTRDPGPWFDEALAALGTQSYPNLSVLVVDLGSATDPTPRVAGVLPSAYVHRAERGTTYGAAANQVLELVDGASFFCFCHDDVALEPDAIRLLVEESFRSNAGLVGPKLVDWDNPRVLLEVGIAADKVGVAAPYAERGELDQEQHDAVRDVFVVPGACLLTRADLFAHLGGFDPEIDGHGEDLELAWRTHLAGARVLVVPSARVRHGERARGVDDDPAATAAAERNRVRTVLTCYSRTTLLRVVPQGLALALLQAIYGLVSGSRAGTTEPLAAWWWNLRRWRDLRARRQRVSGLRQVSDREVRNFQVRGSAQVSNLLRGADDEQDDRLLTMARPRAPEAAPSSGLRRTSVVVAALVVVILVLGSRNLIFGPIPAFGELARFPSSPIDLLRTWWTGWRDIGLGSSLPSPAANGGFGLAGIVFIGAMGQLRRVLILGTLPLGAWGAWRMAKPVGSRRARLATLLVYVAIPVPYNALAQGQWSGLVLYAAAPWMLLGLCRGLAMAPYGRLGLPRQARATEATRVTRPFPLQILGLGLTTALAAILVPSSLLVVVVMAVGLALGSLVVFRILGVGRALGIAVGAAAVAFLLHLPWMLGFFGGGAQWSVLAGNGASVGGSLSLGRLLRFESGPFGAAPLGWAFLVAAALPLLIGRSWRLEWAVRGWFVALTCWGLIWAGQENWIGFAMPPSEVLLAPAAAGLALAAGLGMAAFEVDLPSYRFGWRQAVSLLAALAVVVGALPALGGAVGGRWKVPTSDLNTILGGFIGQHQHHGQTARTLWVGDPEVMPVGAWRLDDRLSYGTSNHGTPSVAERFATPSPRQSARLGDALALAIDGRTTRLGHLLASMGVQYVVIPDQAVPVPNRIRAHPAPLSLKAALASQLDLAPDNPGNAAVTVYRNTAWVPMPVAIQRRPGHNYTDAANLDLPRAPVLTSRPSVTSGHGRLDQPGRVLLDAAENPGWHLSVNGATAKRSSALGWANQFKAPSVGKVSLSYRTSPVISILLVIQVILWLGALELWRRGRAIDRRLQVRGT